jgi:2-polyprenyl-6-hydroxyphenyl methylase / 3-demethylubiquinone-9 3-methyltransferase
VRPAAREGTGSALIDNEYYDEIGDGWWDGKGPLRALHEMNPVRIGYFRRVLDERFPGRAPGDVRILDVGCGGGLLSEGLAGLGYRVTGIDISEGSLRTARRHAERSGVEVEYRSGSAFALPDADDSYDAVVASDVLEHLDDLPKAVGELARVLRPGGVLLFDTINRTAKSYLVSILLAQRLLKVVHPGTHAWRMFIRPGELRRLLAERGLTLAETEGMVPALPLPGVLLSLVRRRGLGGFTLGADVSNSYIGHAVPTGARTRAHSSPGGQ